MNVHVLDGAQVKRDLVEEWHHEGNKALYNAAVCTFIGLATASGVCALCPQRRSATVTESVTALTVTLEEAMSILAVKELALNRPLPSLYSVKKYLLNSYCVKKKYFASGAEESFLFAH